MTNETSPCLLVFSQLPLGGQGLGWLLPTIIIMGITQLFFKPKIEEEKSL